MNDWHVYILRCSDDTLYTGVTTDVERRFKEHQRQGPKCAKYLRGKTPLTLEYDRKAGSRSQALRTEHALKKRSRKEKEDLISGTVEWTNFVKNGSNAHLG